MQRIFQLTAYSLILVFMAVLTGCSGSSSTATTSNASTGAITAKLTWAEISTAQATKSAAPPGVATVRVIISGSAMTTMQQDFAAAANTGTITNIPAGTGLTVTIQGLDSANFVTHQTTVSGVTITAGHTSDLGTVVMAALTNYWRDISSTSAPAARTYNSTVWTGSEMIVWGGGNASLLNDGGRYNPTLDTWTLLSAVGAPVSRKNHCTVWTGSEMIVWGGQDATSSPLGDGARYNPVSNTWTPLSSTGAPTARYSASCVWSGTEMIVWGGYNNSSLFNDGARYNPATNTWTPISTVSAPSLRYYHTAVWTGTGMVVWGGYNGVDLNDGGIYNPTTNSWTPVSAVSAPAGRLMHSVVWTGTEMIVWGGSNAAGTTYFGDGARYNPTSNTWSALNNSGAPSARSRHAAVWTGSKMIVLNGATNTSAMLDGLLYNPATDSWQSINMVSAPTYRYYYGDSPAVWTGSQMLVWGGVINGSTYYGDGGRYTP